MVCCDYYCWRCEPGRHAYPVKPSPLRIAFINELFAVIREAVYENGCYYFNCFTYYRPACWSNLQLGPTDSAGSSFLRDEVDFDSLTLIGSEPKDSASAYALIKFWHQQRSSIAATTY